MTEKQLSAIEKKILEVLKANPQGLDIHQVREKLEGEIDVQQHLDRRLRALDPYFEIQRTRCGQRTVYSYVRERPEGEWDFHEIPKGVRAAVLNVACGRCLMCGRTIADDKIKLHVDHKIPREWGGQSTLDNLWAVCSTCNEGKRNYFATFDSGEMTQVLQFDSVHKRIAELLRMRMMEWVECDTIEFVAGIDGSQTDWRKRLRELRYLGLEIDSKRGKRGNRHLSFYRLRKWAELPADPTQAARQYEKDRARRNKNKSE
jgi:hypothetical protein